MKHKAAKTTLALLMASAVLLPLSASARLNVPADKYVRSANYFLKAGTDIRPEHYPLLARYDLLIFPAEAQVHNPGMFDRLRELNPDVTILAYVPTKSFNHTYWTDSLHRKLMARIDESMWLRDSSGRRISIWPGTEMLNMVGPWQKALPEYVSQDIWSTGLWDGIFYDEFSSNVSWVNGGDIDIHRNGTRDDAYLVDVAWKRATMNMLRDTRFLLGPSAVVVTNGDSTSDLQAFVNGRMFESFPTPWEGAGRWEDSTGSYLRLHDQVGYRPVFVLNGNTGNTGASGDWRKVRYTLATSLLGDGFFSFDFGEKDHGQLWWYDEQDVSLGEPLGPPVNELDPDSGRIIPGVWRRDFRNGVALVNSTDVPRRVEFDAELERLTGRQDPTVNDGRLVESVTLPPKDGLILLKPIESIVGSAFPNGAFARIYDQTGRKLRNGFFAYVSPHGGSDRVAMADLTGDGRPEKIVADETSVSVYRPDGDLRARFQPYGPDYRQGINFAVGDLDGDGLGEIVTGTGQGAGPHVRIFNFDGRLIDPGFFAYDPRFRGGVNVALGDLYGTGRDVIIAGAGPGGGPHVRAFDRKGRVLAQFFAYDYRFQGGVNVAAGDLNGDGHDEIVTGAGPGGGPHVRVFDRFSALLGQFFAGDPGARNGVRVATTDTDGDGRDEIASLTTDVFSLSAVE